MKRLLTPFLFLLVACSSGLPSAREQKPQQAAAPAAAQAGAAKFYRDGLNGVDFSGLDAVAKERALQILNGNKCDCGCGMTIAQCRVEDKSCSRSPVLAAAVVNAVRSGQSDQQVLTALKGMSNAPAAPDPNAPVQPVPKVEISTVGCPSLGPESAPVTVVDVSDFQ